MRPDNSQHFFAQFPSKALKNEWMAEKLAGMVKLPKRSFPNPIFIRSERDVCAGYAVIYDGTITEGELLFICRRRAWKELINRSADLVVVYVDCRERKVYVVTGQMGGFPCFYSLADDCVTISTSFSRINACLSARHLLLENVVEVLLWHSGSYPCDQTIVEEVKQLPPATLLTIDSGWKTQTQPLISWEETVEPVVPFSSALGFVDELVATATGVVAGYLKAAKNLKIGSQLSSGFDSSLVCYLVNRFIDGKAVYFTEHSPLLVQDTNTEIVAKFCQRHGIMTQLVEISDLYQFSSAKNGLKVESRGDYVTDYGFERHWGLNTRMSNDYGIDAVFSGEGGDELMGSHLSEWKKFPIQMGYFLEVNTYMNYGVDKVLAPKAIRIFNNRKRWAKKRVYPSFISPSALAIGQQYFPLYWETGVWHMMPLADPRMVKVAARMPKELWKGTRKQNVWSLRPDIFIPEQFVPKGYAQSWWERFLRERKDLLVGILKKSVLGEMGLIRSGELVRLLEAERFEEISLLAVVQLAIQLEIFLQKYKFTMVEE